MAHRTYGDIDFKHSIWTVQPKAGWSPKTKNSKRDVPVDCGGLTQAIQARMRALDKTKPDLVFPNSLGQPNYHLLRIVKRVAKRAGLTDIRVDDHKFRSTVITVWLRDGVAPQDVMAWVGWSNLSMVTRYAAKLNVRKVKHVRRQPHRWRNSMAWATEG
jgi:site-specific recombinase XerD